MNCSEFLKILPQYQDLIDPENYKNLTTLLQADQLSAEDIDSLHRELQYGRDMFDTLDEAEADQREICDKGAEKLKTLKKDAETVMKQAMHTEEKAEHKKEEAFTEQLLKTI